MSKHFLEGIDTIVLRVSDLDRSKAWYTQNLEFKSISEDKQMDLIVLDTFGPTSLTLWATGEKIKVNRDTTSYPIFRTANAALAHEKLKQKGIEVGELTADAVNYFNFRDPDGNLLEICEVPD